MFMCKPSGEHACIFVFIREPGVSNSERATAGARGMKLKRHHPRDGEGGVSGSDRKKKKKE